MSMFFGFDEAVNMKIKNVLLSVFIVALIYIRSKSEDAPWIGIISYMGFLLALGDLFYEVVYKYSNRVGIGFFILVCILVGIGLIIVLANIFTEIIVLNEKKTDILTLLALLISLPHELYVGALGKIIKHERESKDEERRN